MESSRTRLYARLNDSVYNLSFFRIRIRQIFKLSCKRLNVNVIENNNLFYTSLYRFSLLRLFVCAKIDAKYTKI